MVGKEHKPLRLGWNSKKNSKRNEVTINTREGKKATLEIRYNESPTPLWIWFSPFLGEQEVDLSIYDVVLYWLNKGMRYNNIKLLIKVIEKLNEYGNTEELHDYILTMDLNYEN